MDGFVIPETKVYSLAYSTKGKARFSKWEVQAVIPEVTPSCTGTSTAPPVTIAVDVYLYNGHRYTVKSEHEEELLSIFNEDPEGEESA